MLSFKYFRTLRWHSWLVRTQMSRKSKIGSQRYYPAYSTFSSFGRLTHVCKSADEEFIQDNSKFNLTASATSTPPFFEHESKSSGTGLAIVTESSDKIENNFDILSVSQ